MLERQGSLRERLSMWIKEEKNKDGKRPRRIYEVVEGPCTLLVEETNEAGEAAVYCQVATDHTCVEFKLHGQDGIFEFLRESYNADGAFLIARPDDSVSIWIVECKKTIRSSSWDHALKQFQWTAARLLAVAGVIGVEVKSISLMTAFRYDELSPEASPNPALGKLPVGGNAAELPEEERRSLEALKLLAWMGEDVPLRGFTGRFAHTRVQLDSTGVGNCELGGDVRDRPRE